LATSHATTVSLTVAAPGDFSLGTAAPVSVAQGAIGMVLDSGAIGSLLIDNLNASIHLRALLTDLFLIDEVLKTATREPAR